MYVHVIMYVMCACACWHVACDTHITPHSPNTPPPTPHDPSIVQVLIMQVIMARVLEAYNKKQHSSEAISALAAAATLQQLTDARRRAVAHSEPGPSEMVAARRRPADGSTVLQRAVQHRECAGSSVAKQQLDEAAARDARRDRMYAEHPELYDVGREMLSNCHQTTNFDSTSYHYDVCAPGLESAHCVVTGQAATRVPVALGPCGSMQPPPPSAVVYPNFKVASMLGGAGPNEPADEFEMHDCRISSALHGSVAAENRGVYVRREEAVYAGAVICDHQDLVKGSQEWHRYNVQHRRMTMRESRAAARLGGGLNTWWAQHPGRR